MIDMTTNIYFLQATTGGPIKIGRAKNIKRRMGGHQVSNWQSLKVILLLKDCHTGAEREIQDKFEEFLIRGEWYQEEMLFNLGAMIKKIKLSCPEKRGEKEDTWMLWNPSYHNFERSDLSFKIALYVKNKDRRLRYGYRNKPALLILFPGTGDQLA